MTTKVLLLVGLGFVAVGAGTLPDYLKPCSQSDPNLNECALKHAQEAIPYILKGDKKFGTPALLPLHIPEVSIQPGDNLKLDIHKCVLYGLEDVNIKKVDVDLKNYRASVTASTQFINLQGTYDVNGRILILPITGHGPANITLAEPEFVYTIDIPLVEKKGKKYLKLENPQVTYDTKRAYFQLDNLFNGDKVLGEQMSKFLDENWKEVLGDLGAAVSETISAVITSIIQGYFKKIPFDEVFLP